MIDVFRMEVSMIEVFRMEEVGMVEVTGVWTPRSRSAG